MTIRSTLIERLKNLELITPLRVFFRDLINNLMTSEDVEAYGYTTPEDVEAYGYTTPEDVEAYGYTTIAGVDSHLYTDGYEDLRFPAQSINPAGSAAPPGVDNNDGTLVFSASAVNIIAGVAQMPHGWKSGSAISPHFHYEVTNSDTGNMIWKLEYKIANIGESFPANYEEDTITIANEGTVGKHFFDASWDDIVMTGMKGSCIIKWRISRLGNDEEDTYSSTTKFLEFDIHYQVNKFGSPTVVPI